MDLDGQPDYVTDVAQIWRAARYGVKDEHKELVRRIGKEWMELFDALERLQRVWPK